MPIFETVPDIEEPARLYGRLRLTAELLGGVEFGDTVIDVGGGNGLYVPVIRALGPEEVMIVDPADDQLQTAIEKGIVARKETFSGTLQSYLQQKNSLADTAFVFNMMPRLPHNREFLGALVSVVRSGGWIVMSAREPATALQFRDSMKRYHSERVDHRAVAPPTRPVRLGPTGPNSYIQFWRRV